jgi:large subunit ribosomal protein L28
MVTLRRMHLACKLNKQSPLVCCRTPVQNVPIPLLFPNECHQGLWGGEGIVQGFQKRHPRRRRVPHYWFPNLHRIVIYSEILNKHMSTVVTQRALNLIHENYGLDHYILKVKVLIVPVFQSALR